MDRLAWLLIIAKLQASYGRAVRVSEIRTHTVYSKSSVRRGINSLLDAKMIRRVARGKYVVNDENESIRNIGLSALLPMDVYQYQSELSVRKMIGL